jgi:hypothetical protein
VPEADALDVKLAAPPIGGGMDGAVPVANRDLKRTPHVAESNRCSTERRRKKNGEIEVFETWVSVVQVVQSSYPDRGSAQPAQPKTGV